MVRNIRWELLLHKYLKKRIYVLRLVHLFLKPYYKNDDDTFFTETVIDVKEIVFEKSHVVVFDVNNQIFAYHNDRVLEFNVENFEDTS